MNFHKGDNKEKLLTRIVIYDKDISCSLPKVLFWTRFFQDYFLSTNTNIKKLLKI